VQKYLNGQVKNPIIVLVSMFQELLRILPSIPIDALERRGRIALHVIYSIRSMAAVVPDSPHHNDQVISDINQIKFQVEFIVAKTGFAPRDYSPRASKD
jgi:hypothetical protein